MTNRVLLIEDEPLVQFLWEDVCESLDFPITGQAETLLRAQELVLDENSYDIVILDVNLGRETTNVLAQLLKAIGKPCVVSTGMHADGLDPAFQFFDILSKPFSIPAMVKTLQKLAK